MKPDDRTLLLAGLSAAAGLLLGSASLTIALIAAASPPPVSEYLSGTDSAWMRARVRWMWLVPVLTSLFLAFWAFAQLVVRRPLLTSAETALRGPVPDLRSIFFAAVGIGVLCVLSLAVGIVSVTADGGRSFTDNMAFSGLSGTLSTAALMGSVLSGALFQRWWKATHASLAPPAVHQTAPRPT